MAGGGGGGPAKKSSGPNPITGEAGAFAPKASARESTSVDMTAMIDLVFMMNIFFMVTSLVTASEFELPQARHVSSVDPDESLIMTIVADEKTGGKVYLGEDAESPIPDAGRDEKVAQAVAESVRIGKTSLIIKGDKNLKMNDVGKIGAAAASVEGVKPFYAVTEAGAEEKLH